MLFSEPKKGFATLEMLIAMALIVITICATLPLVFGGQSVAVDSQTNQEALYKAKTLLETARANAKVDFNLVNPAGPVTDGMYQKSLSVSQVDLYTKKVTATVAWPGENNRSLRVSLTTLITNPGGFSNNAVCNSVLASPNGWKNPVAYHWDMGQLGVNGGNGAGFGTSRLFVYNQKLYVAMSDSPATDKDTFFIFDLPVNPSQPPVFGGSVDNAPTINSAGLSDIAVSGSYAYVANGYGANFTTCGQAANCAQLQVIDVSNPASPVVIKNYKIPGVTGSGGQSIGKRVFYSNGYVYVGLAATLGGPEFNVIDVGGGGGPASPTNPIWRGGYSVGNAVNDIFIRGNYAYIATPNTENMTIVNVSNPANPYRAGGSPLLAGGNNGESVFTVGTTVYLGRTFGSREFYILNAANPAAVSIAASQDIGTGSQTSVNSLAVRDYLAFLMTKLQFQVWNIANPASMVPWTSSGTTATFLNLSGLGGTGTFFYCAGDYFYAAIASASGDIISIMVPAP